MDRLTWLSGVFRSEPFLFIFLKAIKLILSDVASSLSWVTDRMLVAEVDFLVTRFNASHLSKEKVKKSWIQYKGLEEMNFLA